MPDKPLTVLTYAASASLAAVALVYFFNPNYLLDGEASSSSANSRKKGVVGLTNPANDCFINAILQSLAGLGDLRLYLIREVHRRELDGPAIYEVVPQHHGKGKQQTAREILSLQSGEVTHGLKTMVDRLNERPIYRKTISAVPFIRVLEHAFGNRISKAQQDAQELLQVVAERLAEEYRAGLVARRRALSNGAGQLQRTEDATSRASSRTSPDNNADLTEPEGLSSDNAPSSELETEPNKYGDGIEDGFPLEGKTAAYTECQHCHFTPKANVTTFVMLNLMVPQKGSATLNECLDAHFKTEYIDDYICDKCRLVHAIETFSKDLNSANSEEAQVAIRAAIAKVQDALAKDPEIPPQGVDLPNTKIVPKRKVARHVKMTLFPKVLVIHLSRSVYDPRSSSTKNVAKVAFPEKLPVGGLLDRRTYKLLGMVTHKGTHNSGHYESHRRQHSYPPYSTPHTRAESGPYSVLNTPSASTAPSPSLPSDKPASTKVVTSSNSAPAPSTPTSSRSASSSSKSNTPPSTRPSSGSTSGMAVLPSSNPTSHPTQTKSGLPSLSHTFTSTSNPFPSSPSKSFKTTKSLGSMDMNRFKRKKRPDDRWWKISDEKVLECKTADVLAMQRDVYMLFYEMERS